MSDTTTEAKYLPLLNGNPTNQLVTLSIFTLPCDIQERLTVDGYTKIATFDAGGTTVYISNYLDDDKYNGLRTSAKKLLDVCIVYLTKQNEYKAQLEKVNTLVSIPIREYIELCGKTVSDSSIREMRKKLNADLETLYNISLDWHEPRRKNSQDYVNVRICQKQGIENGNIIFRFTEDFAQYVLNAYIMQFPAALLSLDERNPNVYKIGRKLALHRSNNSNQRRHTANIISVAALLNACGDSLDYRDKMNGNDRHFTREFAEPFVKCLDILKEKGVISSWEFCNAKNAPLNEEQAALSCYDVFSKLYIKFELQGFPQRELKSSKTKKPKTKQNT